MQRNNLTSVNSGGTITGNVGKGVENSAYNGRIRETDAGGNPVYQSGKTETGFPRHNGSGDIARGGATPENRAWKDLSKTERRRATNAVKQAVLSNESIEESLVYLARLVNLDSLDIIDEDFPVACELAAEEIYETANKNRVLAENSPVVRFVAPNNASELIQSILLERPAKNGASFN